MILNDAVNDLNPTNTMSSNIRIVKICEYCKKEFIAKKTTSKTCSNDCAKRFYALNIKNAKIALAELKTEIKRTPHAFVMETEIRAIQAKELLTLREAAILLNITPLTLRRWTLAGKLKSQKIGRKHSFNKAELLSDLS